MGNTQGKIKNSLEDSSQHESKNKSHTFSLCNKKIFISSNENIFSVICYHTYQKCSFKLIEFPEKETSRNIDSQFGILNLTFKEFITTKKIFEGILKTFQTSRIKLPSKIYVCIISRMWNIFFKFEDSFEEEINRIKRNYKNIIDILEKFLPIENEFEYKFLNSEEYSHNINKNENFSPIVEKISQKKIISPNFGKKKNPKFISLTDKEIKKISFNFAHLRVIPNFHQNLLGFFYEKFDYITDK